MSASVFVVGSGVGANSHAVATRKKNAHEPVRAIVVSTYFLPKFYLLTPRRIVSSYQYVHCSVPSSSCIKQDIQKVIHLEKVIVGAKGAVVQGLADRLHWSLFIILYKINFDKI